MTTSTRRIRARLTAVLTAAGLLIGMLAAAPAASAATAPGWLSTRGSQIVTASGSPYTIKAASWFGMETVNCAPHGLWTISLDEGLATIASMGFNTVRIPFSNECLATAKTSSINASVNPDLVSLTPLKLLDRVIARAKVRGLSVILDRHRPDSTAQSELWYTAQYSEKRWIADWKMLAGRYKNTPTVVGVDLHNEPRGAACWGCGDTARDWRAAAKRAGNAVLAANPRLLIIVEGVENQGDGSRTWWGGGLKDVRKYPLTLSVSNRVVYSPHDYPASVNSQPWFSAPSYPSNLTKIWDANWGYIQSEGIAPVLLGEFGSKLATRSDRQWMSQIVAYLAKKQMSFAFWAFNPNSGDTGGLVGDDWRTWQTAKLAALRPILSGARGTALDGELEPTPSVTPSVTPEPTPSATPTPKATPAPSATPTPAPSATPTPTPTQTPTPSPSTTPAPASSGTPSPSPSPTPRKG